MSKINNEVITYKLSKEEIEEKFKNIKPMTKQDMAKEKVFVFNNFKSNRARRKV